MHVHACMHADERRIAIIDMTVATFTMAGRRLPDRAHTVARRPRVRASARRLQVAARARAELPAQRA